MRRNKMSRLEKELKEYIQTDDNAQLIINHIHFSTDHHKRSKPGFIVWGDEISCKYNRD